LKNCLERAVILSNNGRVTVAELPPEVLRPATISPSVAGVTAAVSGAEAAGPTNTTTAAGSLREVERQQILAALEQTGWHRGKTAEILGISPSTLYRRLRDYDLERRR
jgi:DNA-binding NtrC family response regulator